MVLVVVGVLVIVSPHLIFPVSEYYDLHATVLLPPEYKGFIVQSGVVEVPYRDYWMAWAEVAVGIPMTIAALMIALTRNPEVRKNLALLCLILSVMVLMLPTVLIGTPPNPQLPCNRTTKPALLLLGAVGTGLSLAIFFRAGREKTPVLPPILSTASLVKSEIKGRALRSILAILCIAVALGSIFSATGLMEGLNHSISLQANKLGADIIVVPKGMKEVFEKVYLTGTLEKPFYLDRSLAEKLKDIPQVEVITPQLYMVTLTEASCCAVWQVLLVGFDPETDFIVTPWLSKPLSKPLLDDEIVEGGYMLLPVGGETMFYGHPFKVRAQMEYTGTGFDAAVFMRLEDAYEMAEKSYWTAEKPLKVNRNQVSAFFIRVSPGRYSVEDVATFIHMKILNVDTITSTNMLQTVRNQITGILHTLMMSGGVLWGMATVLSSAIFSMTINERRRELGLLLAIGATKRYIFKLLTAQTLIIALLGGIIGVVGGSATILFFHSLIIPSLEFPYVSPGMGSFLSIMGFTLGLAALTGILAVVYPVRLIGKMDPYSLIRRGE